MNRLKNEQKTLEKRCFAAKKHGFERFLKKPPTLKITNIYQHLPVKSGDLAGYRNLFSNLLIIFLYHFGSYV